MLIYLYKAWYACAVCYVFWSCNSSTAGKSTSGSCCICTAQQPVYYTHQWQRWSGILIVSLIIKLLSVLTPSAVILSIIFGGFHVLKVLTPSVTRGRDIPFPSRLCCRVPGCQSSMHVQNSQQMMPIVLSISHSQWSVATDKILLSFHLTARCLLCSASLSTSQVAAHPAAWADSCRQRSPTGP